MSQRNKFRREFIEKDGSGNIIDVASDLAVDVVFAGAKVSSGATINNGSLAWVEVYHPGRLDVGMNLRIQDAADPTDVSTFTVDIQDRELTALGVWRLQIRNVTGSTVVIANNDRLIVEGRTTPSARVALYADDTSSIALTNPLNGVDGVVEFWCEETDVDLRITKQTDNDYTYGYIVDVHTGGRRQFVNPQDWGAIADGTTDAYNAIQTAIEYSEDSRDRRTVIHITGGEYVISAPLVVTEDDVEIWMDQGTIIKPSAGWSGNELIKIEGNNCIIRGGTLDGTSSVSYGVHTIADGTLLDAVSIPNSIVAGVFGIVIENFRARDCVVNNGGNYGFLLQGVEDGQVVGCEIRDSETSGIQIAQTASKLTRDIVIERCYIDGAGATNPNDGITVNGSSSDATRIDGVLIRDNRISNVDDLGINIKDCTLPKVIDNSLRSIGGTNSGGLDNNHGIRIDSCVHPKVRGNTGDVINGIGIQIIDTNRQTTRGSVMDNNMTNCQQEGLKVDGATSLKMIGNDFDGNSLNAGSTYEVYLAADTLQSIFIGNGVGSNGLYIDPAATVEVGHNWEV